MITPKYKVKAKKRAKIRRRLRARVNGTPDRPRVLLRKSNKYLYAQVIDDSSGRVLTGLSTLQSGMKEKLKNTKNRDAASKLGEEIAALLKKKKIKKVVFDRYFYPYTGRVKLFADAMRDKGITL